MVSMINIKLTLEKKNTIPNSSTHLTSFRGICSEPLFCFCFFNLFFYWRIIYLQNFVVYCQTSIGISRRYTYIPFLNLFLHPTPLGWYRAPVWVSWAIQQIPIAYLFYIWKQCQTLFFGAPKLVQMVTAAMKLKDASSLEEKLWPT